MDESFDLNLKTAITTEKPVFDVNDKFLPHGNYFFTINSLTEYGTSKGKINVNNETHNYEFKNFTVIKLMAKSQSRLFRRTNITHLDMPRYQSPTNSPTVFQNYILESPASVENRQNRSTSVGSLASVGSFGSIASIDITGHNEHSGRTISGSSDENSGRRSPILSYRISPKTEEENRKNLWIQTNETTEPDVCSICLDGFGSRLYNSKKITLTCNHFFHRKCLRNWEKSQKKQKKEFYCPNCKEEITCRY